MKNLNKIKDLTGKTFGRLTVIGLDEAKTGRKTYWICQCQCGNICSCRADSLQGGVIRSCGCLKKEQERINFSVRYTHYMSNTRLYNIWCGLKGRCHNEHDARYCDYGGRGIKVCEQWDRDFKFFYEWAINNGYQDDLTIDRINNDGDYCPENCRWADNKQQARNRRTNINIKIGNATKTLTEWCEIFEVDYKATLSRYNRNGFTGIDDLFNK